jgi:hypothetical protein
MNYGKIIIGIGILIGILLFKKTKPKLLVGILVGLIISFALSFIENQLLTNISFISFGIFSLIFSVYSGIKRKWLNLIIGIFAFVSFFSKLMHYPYANELKLLMIIPIVCFGLTFIKKEKFKNELSILTIFVAYELSEFIKLIEQWIN